MNQEKPYICKALGIKMVVLPRNGNNVLNLNTMKIKHLFLSILLMGVVSMTAQEEARMLRFPTIHGNNVVFSYGGDLYSVDIKGGNLITLIYMQIQIKEKQFMKIIIQVIIQMKKRLL